MKLSVWCAQLTVAMSLVTAAALAQTPPPVTVKTLLQPGGRVDWCPATGLLAYDRLGAGGFYELCTCQPDGSGLKVISAGLKGLPGKNVGHPAWSPDGKWLVFQAEKAEHEAVTAYAPTPGAGICNDLWALDMASGQARPLRVVPSSPDCGVLSPRFSADGKRLSWSEMYSGPRRGGREFGWQWLMVADVQAGPDGLALSNIRKFQPGGPAFYENHGFSPDGKRLIYTTNSLTPSVAAGDREDICVYDLALDRQTRLTDSGYNEHAVFSPDGKQIVWMSNEGIASVAGSPYRGTDYWIMQADGSDKRRLTYFNDPASPMYLPGLTVMSDLSFSPDGKACVGFRQRFLAGGEKTEDDVLVELP